MKPAASWALRLQPISGMPPDFIALQAEAASQAFLSLYLAGGIVLVAAFTVGALIWCHSRKP